MKKLSKLKLKQFHEMSESEMKNVIGGYTDSYSPRCDVGRTCKLIHVNDYNEQVGSDSGTCQEHVLGNTITCFCNAGSYNTPLVNQSGMSHCWSSL